MQLLWDLNSGACEWLSLNQQQGCLFHYWDCSSIVTFEGFYGPLKMDEYYWEWYGVRVIWPRSGEVLLRTTKHKWGVLQWNDHDGGHLLLIDLHPLNWGLPARRGPVAPSNPMQHLHIPERWIGARSLSWHWHIQPCTFGLRSRGEVVFAVWTHPTIKRLTAGTQSHDLGPELLGNLHQCHMCQ